MRKKKNNKLIKRPKVLNEVLFFLSTTSKTGLRTIYRDIDFKIEESRGIKDLFHGSPFYHFALFNGQLTVSLFSIVINGPRSIKLIQEGLYPTEEINFATLEKFQEVFSEIMNSETVINIVEKMLKKR